jgi:Cna protein B-type domain.
VLTAYGEPVGEIGSGGSGTGTPAYPGILPDASVNETIDFGFRLERVALGNYVYMDNNSDGLYNAGDMPVSNVVVWLYAAGANYGVDAPLAVTTTNAAGYYYFDQLAPGQYVVYIPAVNFGAGQPLEGNQSTPGQDGTQTVDNNDNGQDAPVNGGIVSNIINLQPGVQPVGENQTDYPGTLPDDNVNGTVDFGFRQSGVAVGNFVYTDNNANSVYDAGDMPVSNVVVWLYAAGANYGVDAPLAVDVTDASGYYYFDNLVPGQYVVYIPAVNFGAGGALQYKESVPGQDLGDAVDNNDNGNDTPVNGGVVSNVFVLTAYGEPVGEIGSGGSGTGTPAYPGILPDASVNETIDFGFRLERVALGNYVYMDNNSDGLYNAGDMPVSNVVVWLYAAGANYGVDAPLAVTTTTLRVTTILTSWCRVSTWCTSRRRTSVPVSRWRAIRALRVRMARRRWTTTTTARMRW